MMIETDRLLLRPFCGEDAADVFEYLKEPEEWEAQWKQEVVRRDHGHP